jgi:hypothetical protein
MFSKNYLLELPEDLQITIYKNVFSNCISDIENDKGIKYLNRLYSAVNNPNNTCIYSIKPKGMFSDYDSDNDFKYYYDYKYKRIAQLEGFGSDTKQFAKDMIYLDRAHLLEDTSHLQSNTISYFLYPLLTANKLLRKYLTIRFNLIKFYSKDLTTIMKVVDDRVDIICIRNFRCNADIYYNIMVGYNVLYNSLSNIIYSEENVEMFHKFVEIFQWVEANKVFEGYNVYDNKIIPIFEIKNDL